MEDLTEVPHSGTTTRRDALKLGGIAALGGAAAALASSAAAATDAGAVSPPAHIPTSLKVAIDGFALQGVRSMEVLSASYALDHSTDATGAWVSTPVGLDSQVVSFTRYFTGDAAFSNLFESQNGKQQAESRTVTVRVLGRRGSTANLFTLFDCFPVSWQGPTYDAAVMAKGGSGDRPTESISMAFQKITWK